MEIFIRQLPESVSRQELMTLIGQAIPSRWSLLGKVPTGEMLRCQIIKITDADSGTTEFHGWADIEPVSASQHVIEKLSASSFCGQRLQVRKYHRRSSLHDRRRYQISPQTATFSEKRMAERRRPNLLIELLHAGAADSGQVIFQPAEAPD